ncbi:uncharacterized protein LOC114365242 [Ostrinia furnacalis]|uniref:uncharacterized protein LOC114365242 n=1 Tax=Ostrinia furnacalis TaxID=93504 RepID=UPI00103DFB66|nr:uncharacterized protein LOC114365242 [Ostrinia furnacalis]
MNNVRLYILRLVLACIILNAILVAEAKKKHHNVPATTAVHQASKHQDISKIKNIHKPKHPKKSKRSTYRRSWSSKEYSYMPPYLVFNRKVGAYYPYYVNPENNNRRSMVARQG